MPDALTFQLHLKRGEAFNLDVDGDIPLDGITAVTGPSGSGKTTFLRALAGLDPDVEGRRAVVFRGTVWDDDGVSLPPEERRVGMVFQEPALFPHLSVAVNVGYGARRRGVTSISAIVEALELAPLMARDVTGLSGGEARRVALARALASDPAIVLLDEPMSGLDFARKADFLPYIARAVVAARVPAIYVTHSGEEIAMLADRVLALRDGRLVGWQTPPMRLNARVAGTGRAGMTVVIDGADEAGIDGTLTVPVRAVVGEAVGLGMTPDSIQLSTNHPGEGSALAVLPASVVRDEVAGGATMLSVLGQTLALPTSLRVPTSGSKLWLSIMRVLPRPQPGDSAT